MATKVKEKSAGEQHVDSLRDKYEKLAAKVPLAAANTPEHHDAMEAKKTAFLEYKTAKDANDAAELAVTDADQKQAAADAAVREAGVAKRRVGEAARSPERAAIPPGAQVPRPAGR